MNYQLRIDSDMTIYQAASLKVILENALEKSQSLIIDLSGVSEIDTTGLQLLLLLRRHSKLVSLTMPSQCITQLSELLQLQELLGFEKKIGEKSL